MSATPVDSSANAGPKTTVPTKEAGRGWTYHRDPEVLSIGGVDVALRRDGSGEPLLFLHDAWFLRQWLPIHIALAKDFDVLAPEVAGFGDSEEDPRFEDLTDAVLQIDSVLRSQGVGPVHVVGVGFGARLGAHLAATIPDRVASLVLVAPTALREGEESMPDQFRIPATELHARLLNDRQVAFEDTFLVKGFPDDQVDVYSDSKAHALFTWTQRVDLRLERRAYRITAPTLVVAAGDDRIAPQTAAARTAAIIPDAQLVVFPGPDGAASAHALHIEQPDELAALVAGHIRGIAGKA